MRRHRARRASGAHTQAASLNELRANPCEVLELCLEADEELRSRLSKVVGAQQVEAT